MRLAADSIILVFVIFLVVTVQPPLVVAVPPPNVPVLDIHNPVIYSPASTTVPGSPPFAPRDIWKAYNYLPLFARGIKGNGTRIAIIDAYGDPSLSSDLSSFNSLTGLPSTTVNIYYPDGAPAKRNGGWSLETALDTEWAHAVAPDATIDVIVAFDNSLQHMYDAIQYVANNLPQETTLSMSWGDYESNYSTTGLYNITSIHQLFTVITGHGTSLFSSSGDSGSASCCMVQYPASDPLVVGVGGTTLHLDSNASYVSEQAWSGSGAGDSIVYPKPAWQKGLGDPLVRASVDVSYDASQSSGFLVVLGGISYTVGGTSAGSPQWAALVALASQASSLTFGAINPKLYSLSSYHDVLTGSNGFYSAAPGWDYPSGLGTPDAYGVVTELSRPIPVPINDTQVFQGVSVTTSATLSIAMFTGKLSGQATVLARNSTTGALLFNKTYNVDSLQLQSKGSTYSGSFLLNIPVGTFPLSSDVQVTEVNGAATATFTVTRRIDITGKGVVNTMDLAFVANDFGATLGSPKYDGRADIIAAGTVVIIDLAYVAAYFGATDYI